MFVLVYDLPARSGFLRKRLTRLLTRSGARRLQSSAWISPHLQDLERAADFIHRRGGRAVILRYQPIRTSAAQGDGASHL
jgi:CRISPR/Cas system-associated endoribonuclease Cas2